jgi:hypothetical protein
LETLELKLQNMRRKYESVLAYFGEDGSMASQDFFETLLTFVDSFVGERRAAEMFRAQEARKSTAAAAAVSRQERATLNVSGVYYVVGEGGG